MVGGRSARWVSARECVGVAVGAAALRVAVGAVLWRAFRLPRLRARGLGGAADDAPAFASCSRRVSLTSRTCSRQSRAWVAGSATAWVIVPQDERGVNTPRYSPVTIRHLPTKWQCA